jgi:tetratricopeptide (TPR) repeat protein
MNINAVKKCAVILVVSAFTGLNLTGQTTRNDVIKVFNEGVKTVQTDIPASIKSFESVITLSDQAGETAADLKQKAQQVLPGLYFKLAYNSLNEKKPAPQVIREAKTAIAVADKFGSASNKANAEKVLVQAYSTMATDYFSNNDYEKALATFDTLLSINPDYLTAIYNKALIYMKQNNLPAFEETIDKFLKEPEIVKDPERTKQASTLALEYFRAAGSQANQAGNLEEALSLLTKAEKYGEDKDLCYFFADVYNKQKNFDKGAEYARKGLDLETGDAEAKAKFYFQLGLAQAGKGETANACASFKNASYGAFAEASKAERKNLKCE